MFSQTFVQGAQVGQEADKEVNEAECSKCSKVFFPQGPGNYTILPYSDSKKIITEWAAPARDKSSSRCAANLKTPSLNASVAALDYFYPPPCQGHDGSD